MQTGAENSQESAQLKAIFQMIEDSVIFTNIYQKIMMVNPAFTRIFGYSEAEVIGKKIDFLCSGLADCDSLKFNINCEICKIKINFRTKNNQVLLTEIINNSVLDNEGNILGFVSIIKDIGKEEWTKEILHHQVNMLREQADLLEMAEDIIIIRDMQQKIIFCNERVQKLYGWEKADILGDNYYHVFQPIFNQSLTEIEDKLMNLGEWKGEIIHITKKGETLILESSWSLQKDHNNKPINILEVNNNITKRKKVEEALKDSQERLQLALDSIKDGLWDWNITTGKAYFSPRWLQMLGYNVGELPYHISTWQNLLHPDDKEMADLAIKNHLNDSISLFEFEHRLQHKSGEWKWILGRGKVVTYDQNGNPVRMVGTTIDITERKEIIASLAQSEEALRFALESAQMGSWDWNTTTGKLTYSQHYGPIFGLPLGDYHPSYEDFINSVHPEDQEYLSQSLKNILVTGTDYQVQFRIFTPSGELRWIENKGKIYRDEKGNPVRMSGVSMNITERKQAEITLQKQLQKIILLKQITQEIRSSLNTDKILQTTAIEVGKTFQVSRSLIHIYHQEPVEKIPVVVEYLIDDSISMLGLEIPIIGNPHVQQVILQDQAVVSNNVYTDPLLIWAKDFCEQINLKSMLVVRTSYNGETNGIIALHQCDRYREWTLDEIELIESVAAQVGIALAQAKLLEREIKQREELTFKNIALEEAKINAESANKAKSEFLAMMSHEIRTPMNAVIGMTGLLLDTNLTNEQYEFVEIIRNSGENLLTLINDILNFSKIESGKLNLEFQPYHLKHCIEEALDLLAPLATSKGLELAYILEPDLPRVIMGDMTRLRQILVNLISNGVKFTQTGEIVVYVQSSSMNMADENEPEKVEITIGVKDTGIGIPPERMDKLFKPFSQGDTSITREYGGTGLGLVISRRLTELMGGKMWVESEVGKGTTFYFTILAEVVPSSAIVDLNMPQDNFIGKRLLIIDENVTNRKIITMQGQTWGMQVTTTDSLNIALDWLGNDVEFDLAIVNIEIPEDGVNIAKQIKNLSGGKNLHLVMMSASSKIIWKKDEIKSYFAGFITKPIKQSDLYDVLAKVLNNKSLGNYPMSIGNQFKGDLATQIPLKMLLVEDIVVNQKVALQMLKRLGYRADIANNGQEALECLYRQSYDVVFMDVQMPIMDGLEATKRIRQKWGKIHPWIIAMTAHARPSDRQECLDSGMNDYISKPVRIESLVQALMQLNKNNNLPVKAPVNLVNSSSSTDSKIMAIDLKIMQSLRDIAGEDDEDFITEIIDNYLLESPEKLQLVIDAISENNVEELVKVAHGLGSSSISIGANKLAKICREIEAIAKKGQNVDSETIIPQLKLEYQQVEMALINIKNHG